ncbi:hypothetical protein [Micromonospora sp. WMMD710]|uniref:hypothetical protein n=1 Tax=Micromonospora sp. WMMD710 TaxID=3016085 RepID=UPI002417806C|nr:hypothetical protein [Micromonospora sp. WMMD710]MDG4761427.1 hypothetical protein [Micromonospora sp. WMMD710]
MSRFTPWRAEGRRRGSIPWRYSARPARLQGAEAGRDYIDLAGCRSEIDVVGLQVQVDHVEAVSGQGGADALRDSEACRDDADEGGADGGSGELDGSAWIASLKVGEGGRGSTSLLGDVTLPTRNLVAADLSGESAQEHGVEVSRSDAESGVDGELPADSGDEPARVEAVDAEQRDMVVVDKDSAGGALSPVLGDLIAVGLGSWFVAVGR